MLRAPLLLQVLLLLRVPLLLQVLLLLRVPLLPGHPSPPEDSRKLLLSEPHQQFHLLLPSLPLQALPQISPNYRLYTLPLPDQHTLQSVHLNLSCPQEEPALLLQRSEPLLPHSHPSRLHLRLPSKLSHFQAPPQSFPSLRLCIPLRPAYHTPQSVHSKLSCRQEVPGFLLPRSGLLQPRPHLPDLRILQQTQSSHLQVSLQGLSTSYLYTSGFPPALSAVHHKPLSMFPVLPYRLQP